MTREIHRKIKLASLFMVASIILSRIIGFLREWIIAHTMGATAMTDVYYASFTIPDFLNYLMAAGALSISFIPILSEFISRGDEETGKRVFRSIATWFGGVLLVFILLAEVFARHLGFWIAPGFTGEQFDVLAKLIRIILPAQLFFFWGGLAISVQHTHGRFLASALAPILYNTFIILFGLLFHGQLGVTAFSYGVLAGAMVGQGLVQWIAIRRLGYSCLPLWTISPEVRSALKRYLWLTFPIMLGFSLAVTDEWISKYFASAMQTKAVSWLSYARTGMRIPIAILGQAAGIASYPYLAQLWAEKNYREYTETLFIEIQKLWALAPIAAILMITHALPIMHFIFGSGRFGPEDLDATADLLRIFGMSVFFWTLQILLARGFYAAGKTWVPSLIGTVISILAIPLYQYLGRKFSFYGLALAGCAGISVYTLVLWVLLRRYLQKFYPELPLKAFLNFCLAWCVPLVVMGFLATWIYQLGIYHGTRLSALADILIVCTVLGTIAFTLLRTVFKRFTGEPLF